jgi:hypothetical protein
MKKESKKENAMHKVCILTLAVCSACLHLAAAEKAFERVDKFPEGEQGGTLRSMTSVRDTNTVTVSVKAPYEAVWSAIKVVAQKFDKIGNRPIVGVSEQSGRIQNGKIQLDSMILSGSLVDWRDEFLTEATAIDPQTTKLSVTRKLVRKETFGSGRWGAHSSNGKIERWLITQVLDEMKSPSTAIAGGSGKTAPTTAAAASVFVSNDNPTDILTLNADSSFRLTERGRQFGGKFEWSGDTLTLIVGRQRMAARLVGETLTDNEGKLWTRRVQPEVAAAAVGSAPPAQAPASTRASGEVIANADIVKLVQAKLSDAIIIAKIKSSLCRFDLSTDALIKLKDANISDSVIQAMTEAPGKK